MNTTLIIGAGVVVGGAVFLLSRRAAAAPQPLSTRYTSIDRSAAGGGMTPEPVYSAPTVFANLGGAPPPPPPPAADSVRLALGMQPMGACPDGYVRTSGGTGLGAISGGKCVPPSDLELRPTVPSPAPSSSCPWYNPLCAAKTVGKALVDVNKRYVSYSVDQFKKGLAATAGDKIKNFQPGVTRGAA
jgi:hypothetical protein